MLVYAIITPINTYILESVMELDKNYSPQNIETTWYEFWESKGYFKPTFNENAPNYSIFLPPPNVTGTLHMGHGFQHTLQDALIRYHRMRGYNTLWQPGTDHAGIAVQILVERQLNQEGLTKHDLGRDKFLERVWEWKGKSGGTITKQMRRLGASCDWNSERFTMDEDLSDVVTQVFVELYNKGYIYRGKRLVNWDVKLQTAVSDLEVISKEKEGHLWHVLYPFSDGVHNGMEGVVIATTRPETMLGDVAVAVHPEDERYSALVGKSVKLPLCDREIPIIADEMVDPEFGSGCVKITGAHDFNDYECAKRHNLELVSIMDLTGHINENAPKAYQGLDRFVARKRIVQDLEQLDLLVQVVNHKHMLPHGDRTDEIIEPLLTDQWFMDMDQFAKTALQLVKNGEIDFVPSMWISTYNQWLENIQPWCISRQLWWGHQIPAYYDEDGNVYVAKTKEEAKALAKDKSIIRDPDVLDTWFSAALWCFSTLGYPTPNKKLQHFLPSSVLVTGFDIIFFWVARMIMLTHEFTGQIPFKDVFVTGLIQDAHGNKMSKSKGNIIDPLDLVDGITIDELVKKRTANLLNPKQAQTIATQTQKDYPQGFSAFGADALRFTFAALATHGREVRFDVKRIEGSRNFCNKLWNATRFVLMSVDGHKELLNQKYTTTNLDSWIMQKLGKLIEEVDFAYSTYRFDLICQKIYEFVWNEYCDWYLELAKVNLQGEDINAKTSTINTLCKILEMVLRIIHPIMPFITEALWQEVAPLVKQQTTDSIMIAAYPQVSDLAISYSKELDESIDSLKELIINIRNLRANMNLNPGQKVPLVIEADDTTQSQLALFIAYILQVAKISEITFTKQITGSGSPIAIVNQIKLMLSVEIDVDAELARLNREVTKLEVELEKLNQKLNNPSFVERAPKDLVARDQERVNQINKMLVEFRNQISSLSK